MKNDRSSRIRESLESTGLAAIVCALPANVLLLTGYWPVVGTSIAICARNGSIVLLAPEDELEMAEQSFADSVETFVPESFHGNRSLPELLRPRLSGIFSKLKISSGLIGFDSGENYQAASYLAMHLYGAELRDMLHEAVPEASLLTANAWLAELGAVKTEFEIANIRSACAIAKAAYQRAAAQLAPGLTEFEAAELLRSGLATSRPAELAAQRCDGFAFCMSGTNSAKASAAYARTRGRVIQATDLIMMHCNSYVDGFWTDITRTYTPHNPNDQQARMFAAVHAARKAALSVIKANARAEDVDFAARETIREFGLGSAIRHSTGHGVGFCPMSPDTIPRIRYQSGDVLQEGMVFNVEPAVYIEGYGGVRHCDMVAVTKSGHELLTAFQPEVTSLTSFNRQSSIGLSMRSGGRP